MKIQITKKEYRVMLACMEEMSQTVHWVNNETLHGYVSLSSEGAKEVGAFVTRLSQVYGCTEQRTFHQIFDDLELKKCEEKNGDLL